MCRLFGFRSVVPSQVHTSLVKAENALMTQSNEHPDGWGIAYYVAKAPHIVKSMAAAVEDNLFQRVSGIVSAETVLAHLRKATQGELTITNTHPFQYGPWVFAHNGNIKNFQEKRQMMLQLMNPKLRRFILGETDSEALFYLLLSFIEKKICLTETEPPLNVVVSSVREALNQLIGIAGPFHQDPNGPPEENYFSFLLTNGVVMLAYHGGKELYYSTYKTRCPERHLCASFSQSCEAVSEDGLVNHFIVASEPLGGVNVWLPVPSDTLMGVDRHMRFMQVKR